MTEFKGTQGEWQLIEIVKNKPNVKDFDYQPYGYINALQNYVNKLEKALSIDGVVWQNEQIPKLTLDQAIEKAKPNMDKIEDVDAHLNGIK